MTITKTVATQVNKMLGKQVADTVTDIKGTCVAVIFYKNGCVQYQIQPKIVVDGVPAVAGWYDSAQVKLVKEERVNRRGTTGGPPPKTVPHFGK